MFMSRGWSKSISRPVWCHGAQQNTKKKNMTLPLWPICLLPNKSYTTQMPKEEINVFLYFQIIIYMMSYMFTLLVKPHGIK